MVEVLGEVLGCTRTDAEMLGQPQTFWLGYPWTRLPCAPPGPRFRRASGDEKKRGAFNDSRYLIDRRH